MADDENLHERLQATMVAIGKHFEHEDFEKALPLCQKAGDVKPDCPILRRCRVFCLLNLNRWADALQMCEKLACNEESFAFEKAYCLYRLNRFPEALKALGSSGKEQEGRNKRLEAQIHYRMGDYSQCAEMYERLYDDDPEDLGLLVNALASQVSGTEPHRASSLMSGKEELLESSSELCFNLACAYIEEGRLEEAAAKLQEAKQLCIAELLEGEDEDEDEENDEAKLQDHEELAAISVQTAVVLQRQGGQAECDQANDVYARILKPRGSDAGAIDPTVLAVASNNIVSLRQEGKNMFDSVKRINCAAKEAQDLKLTHKQAVQVSINKILLLLQGRKLEQAKAELQKLGEEFKDTARLAVLQAAIAYREKNKAKGAEEVLQAHLDAAPGSDAVLVCLAQLHAQQKSFDKAAEALDQLSRASRAQPKNAEIVVAFHTRQKCPEKAVACLRDAIKYWSGEGDGEDNEAMLGQILRISSQMAAQTKDRAFAAEVHQLYLERVDGSDVDALCGLVQSLANVDPERATEYAQRLQLPDYAHLDPEDLESGAAPKLTQATKQAGDEQQEKVQHTKRKRKPRYPKNYDPENPGPAPDPERWLPKTERSEYKKKMRKKEKNLMRGPQGAMVTDDKAFRKTGPSTAQVEVASDNTARPKGTTKNKKGKK